MSFKNPDESRHLDSVNKNGCVRLNDRVRLTCQIKVTQLFMFVLSASCVSSASKQLRSKLSQAIASNN